MLLTDPIPPSSTVDSSSSEFGEQYKTSDSPVSKLVNGILTKATNLISIYFFVHGSRMIEEDRIALQALSFEVCKCGI